jgi:nucleotide-binding universal stress UspA family protein
MSLYTSVLKRVLVATDLSGSADHALGRALQLAATRGAELDIVHVIEEQEGLPAEAQAELAETHQSAVSEKLAARPLADKVNVTIDLVVGRAETDIVERAVMANADCIVLGLHDRLLPENLDIEDTLAETVIGATELPVLLVAAEPKGPYRTAIVGVDLASPSRAAVEAAVLVAPDAALHLVHASGEDEDAGAARQRLESFVAGEQAVFERAAGAAGLPKIAVTAVAKHGDPRQVLTAEIKKRGADLLVLATGGRTGLARTLLGSVTTDLINERLCDVLVIRREE